MSIASEVIRNDHIGDGVTDTFPFEFVIYNQGDLDVYVDGVVQVVDINFTVDSEDIEVAAGGNIVFGIGYIPADGAKVAILSGAPYTQLTVLAARDDTYEDTYDKAVILIKQLREVIGRGLQLSTTSLYSGLSLPDPISGYYLRWKSDLSGLENIVAAPAGGNLSLLDVDVTIVAGTIDVSDGPAHYVVDTEGGAASDNLEHVIGLTVGDIFTISAKDGDRSVVIINGAYFKTAGGLNCTLSNTLYEITFRMGSGSVAYELSRSSNA